MPSTPENTLPRMETPYEQLPDFIKQQMMKEPQGDIAARVERVLQQIDKGEVVPTPERLESLRLDADKLPAIGSHEDTVLKVHRLLKKMEEAPQEPSTLPEETHGPEPLTRAA